MCPEIVSGIWKIARSPGSPQIPHLHLLPSSCFASYDTYASRVPDNDSISTLISASTTFSTKCVLTSPVFSLTC